MKFKKFKKKCSWRHRGGWCAPGSGLSDSSLVFCRKENCELWKLRKKNREENFILSLNLYSFSHDAAKMFGPVSFDDYGEPFPFEEEVTCTVDNPPIESKDLQTDILLTRQAYRNAQATEPTLLILGDAEYQKVRKDQRLLKVCRGMKIVHAEIDNLLLVD